MNRPEIAYTMRGPLRVVAVLVGFACLGIIAAVIWRSQPSASDIALTEQASREDDATIQAATIAPLNPAPSFDIVRVSPDGTIILAGRAAPGAQVTVAAGNKVVAEARADRFGAWMATPEAKLEPGADHLILMANNPDGSLRLADSPVEVIVPPRIAAGAAVLPAMAILTPTTGASRLLQAPAGTIPAGKLGLGVVDYDDQGAIRFSGGAPPGAPLRLYVDNTLVGDTVADASGHWTFSPPGRMVSGVHRLRLDQLTDHGLVAGRVEVPFQSEALDLSQVGVDQVVVEPGQNLWRLARRVYGSGLRYTVIYTANRDHIRDAKLIYPGQVFTLPSGNP